MKLYDFIDFSLDEMVKNVKGEISRWNDIKLHGIIHSLCEVDYLINLTPADENGKLGKIFYPHSTHWTEGGSSAPNLNYLPDDIHYLMRSGNKDIQCKFERFKDILYLPWNEGISPSLYNKFILKLLEPFYLEHIDNWLKLYDDLMEPYRPFSNYYLDEEMVRNEKTGSSNTANASSSTTTNRSEGTSSDNENGSSSENTSGEVTNKVKGYNSTEFLDAEHSNNSSSSSTEYENSSTSESLDEGTENSESEGTRDVEYNEEKTYLLRYTGALDVDFQEWLKREIDLRRNHLIEDIIFADIDKYLCKGVY